MRTLTLYIATSLDGYIAQPNDDLSFLKMVEREGEDYGYESFLSTIDTILLGRKTYDWVVRQIGSSHYDQGDRKVYVITRTARPAAGNTTFYTGDLTELVHGLKSMEGKNIFCDGGAEIANELMRHDLIDEYIISVVPVFLGAGIRLFQEERPMQQLELVSSQSFESGLVQMHYRRKRTSSPLLNSMIAANSPPPEGCPQGGVGQDTEQISGPQGGVGQDTDQIPGPQGGVGQDADQISGPQGGVGQALSNNSVLTYINDFPIFRQIPPNLPRNPDLRKRVREKRKAGILSEVLFWKEVHQGKFHHLDFDRQTIVGNYIVDFYVKSLGLVVEIDGDSHLDHTEYDAKRENYLKSCGLRVYRILDFDVKNNLDRVLRDLEEYLVRKYGKRSGDSGE